MTGIGGLALYLERHRVGGRLGDRRRQIDRGATKRRNRSSTFVASLATCIGELPVGRSGQPTEQRLRGVFGAQQRSRFALPCASTRTRPSAPAMFTRACPPRISAVSGDARTSWVENTSLPLSCDSAGTSPASCDAVVGKVVFADDLVAFRFPQGQLEPERQCSGSRRHRLDR